MTKCTWQDCQQEATIPQLRGDGSQWANLCAEHAKEVEDSIDALDAKKLLRAWVKSLGGAKRAAETM